MADFCWPTWDLWNCRWNSRKCQDWQLQVATSCSMGGRGGVMCCMLGDPCSITSTRSCMQADLSDTQWISVIKVSYQLSGGKCFCFCHGSLAHTSNHTTCFIAIKFRHLLLLWHASSTYRFLPFGLRLDANGHQSPVLTRLTHIWCW